MRRQEGHNQAAVNRPAAPGLLNFTKTSLFDQFFGPSGLGNFYLFSKSARLLGHFARCSREMFSGFSFPEYSRRHNACHTSELNAERTLFMHVAG